MKKNKEDFPGWLRGLLFITAILYLLWLLFIKAGGPMVEHFPFFRR